MIGIGVDENTAFLIQGKIGRVIGPTQVLIIEKKAQNKKGREGEDKKEGGGGGELIF